MNQVKSSLVISFRKINSFTYNVLILTYTPFACIENLLIFLLASLSKYIWGRLAWLSGLKTPIMCASFTG